MPVQPDVLETKYESSQTRTNDKLPHWAIRAGKAVTTVARYKILRWFFADWVNPTFSKCPEPYTARFLTPAMVREFAKDPESDMSEGFLSEALSKGDECFGILDHGSLAAYSWYSSKPTRIRPRGLAVHFDEPYIFMYKGFTRDRYRGQRLHAIGKTMALQAYKDRGFRGMISNVDYNNFASLKSARRMGARLIGEVYILAALEHYLIYISRGCRRFGLRIERLRPPQGDPSAERPSPTETH